MNERIQEILRLIDVQLALAPDNPIEEQYKARTLASYVQALNGLLTAQKSYKEENISEQICNPYSGKKEAAGSR